MSTRQSLFFFLFGLILLCLSDPDISSPADEEDEEDIDSKVVTLTQTSFGEFVQQNQRVLVEFYAPWCGHCKALKPKYEEAAKILEDQSPTILAKLDATEAPILAEQFGIKGYPTLIMFEGVEATPYSAGRETKDIVDWVLQHDIPAYARWTYKQYEDSKSIVYDYKNNDDDIDKQYMIFGFVKAKSKRERLFKAFADELRAEKTMSFYLINFIKPDDKYHIILRRNNRDLFENEQLDGEFEVSYNGKLAPTKKARKSLFKFKSYDLGTWLHEHRYPFFVNLDAVAQPQPPSQPPDSPPPPKGQHPYSVLYAVPKVPRGGVIIIRIPEKDDAAIKNLKEELIESVRDLRAKEGYMVLLTSLDQDRIGFTSDVDMLLIHKSVEKLPKLPASFKAPEGDPNRNNPGSYFTQQQEQQTGKKPKETLREYRYQWRIKDDGAITSDVLSAFVRNREEHGRWLRSSSNTDTADDIYYDIITASTFNDIVLDSSTDVLVLYCTSWGKYCQPFMEEYNNLAQHVQTFYQNKSIKITYLDCDENDVDDIRVSQFPQLILYPGGTTTLQDGKLLGDQQRTVDDIVDFIDEFAQSLNKDEL